MRLKFHKYQGCGNDFLLLDAAAEPRWLEVDLASRAAAWCERRFGVGADQILVVGPSSSSEAITLRIVNADGTSAGMCGNGLRCVARHAAEVMGCASNVITIDIAHAGTTRRYPVRIVREDDRREFEAAVDMGEPGFSPREIPTTLGAGHASVLDLPMPEELASVVDALDFDLDLERTLSCVSMGNPHAVIFCRREVPTDLAANLGPVIECSPWFPEHVNVHFVHVEAKDRMSVTSYERGAGLTQACGSGACASVVAAAATDRVGRAVSVRMPGGVVRVTWGEAPEGRPLGGRVELAGPAERVFEGYLSLAT
jgi:diaminopimelate epimerase